MTTPDRFVVLHFLADAVAFEGHEAGTTRALGSLPVSAETVASRYFPNEVPSEADVEDAINFIEDRIMENPGLKNNGARLVTADPRFAALVRRHFSGLWVPRAEVEGLFTRYALQSMGRSAVYDNLVVSRLDYALLLIVREILHHEDFDGIEVWGGTSTVTM